MKITKQITALFLLCIFLFNTMGYFVAFKVAQDQIKSDIISEINAGVSTNEETIITINRTDLASVQWLEDGKEIRYNNQRYDVVKSKEDKSTVTYYCINDKQEETLFADLDNHINTHIITNTPIKNNSSKSLVNDVVKIFFTHQQQFNLNVSVNTISFFQIKEDYISASIKTNSPPPRFV